MTRYFEMGYSLPKLPIGLAWNLDDTTGDNIGPAVRLRLDRMIHAPDGSERVYYVTLMSYDIYLYIERDERRWMSMFLRYAHRMLVEAQSISYPGGGSLRDVVLEHRDLAPFTHYWFGEARKDADGRFNDYDVLALRPSPF